MQEGSRNTDANRCRDMSLSTLLTLSIQAAAEMLKDEEIGLVVRPPVRRAAYGARQVAKHHGLEITEDDRCRAVVICKLF